MEAIGINIKAIGGTLVDAAGPSAQMRVAAAESKLRADTDRTADLLDAVRHVDGYAARAAHYLLCDRSPAAFSWR